MNDEDSDQMKVERRRHFEALASEEGNGASPIAAGGEIVTVHPLADEYDLLSRLGIRPEECVSVDSYWSIDGDVVFLQLIAASQDSFREPGLYGCMGSYPPRHVNLVVVVDEPYITQDVLEKAAGDLRRVGWGHVELGEKLVKLSRDSDKYR